MDLNVVREKRVRFAIGLMCNPTGLGIDAALVRIKGTGPSLSLKYIAWKSLPYAAGLRIRLSAPKFDGRELGVLNFELGELLAEAALEMLHTAGEEKCEVDFIAMQGHALGHTPPRLDSSPGILTLGESSVVAERRGLPVVSEFAQREMAAGGQGAPLEAYPDWVLFGRSGRTVACIHLSAITSMTVITPKIESIMAFHTGPGVLAIDGALRHLTNGMQESDSKGVLGAKGEVIDEFLEYLLDNAYFNRVPPKSASRDEFGFEAYLRDALAARTDHSLNDLMTTLTTAVSYSIIRSFNRFVKSQYDVSRVVLTGEGAHNATIVDQLKKGLPPNAVVRTSDEYNVPPDAWAAMAVAILGNEAIFETPANIPGATGSKHPVVLGKFTLP